MRPTCVDKVFELAERDPRVAYIGSDLDPPLVKRMKQEMPGRAFMEGVSEQHIVGMSAGLAMEGFIPYVHTIATFITRRCYEQVAVDLCLHNLPVRLREPVSLADLFAAMARDKKARTGGMRFVVLKALGTAETRANVDPALAEAGFLEVGAAK